MKLEVRERDRRALFLLAAVGLVYVVVSFGVLPAFDALKESSSGVGEKEEQLAKYRRALIRKGRYTQLLVQARENVSRAEGRLVRGDNSSLAAVELQTIVEDAAKKVGLDLNQRSVSAARKKDEFFNEITMTLTFESTPGQVSNFLAELRAAPKSITVPSAQIAPAQVIQEAPKGEFRKTVRVNLTLSALLPSPEKRQ